MYAATERDSSTDRCFSSTWCNVYIIQCLHYPGNLYFYPSDMWKWRAFLEKPHDVAIYRNWPAHGRFEPECCFNINTGNNWSKLNIANQMFYFKLYQAKVGHTTCFKNTRVFITSSLIFTYSPFVYSIGCRKMFVMKLTIPIHLNRD